MLKITLRTTDKNELERARSSFSPAAQKRNMRKLENAFEWNVLICRQLHREAQSKWPATSMSAILFSPAFSPQKGHQTIAILETTHFPFSSTGSNFTFNSPGIFTCPAVSSSLVLLFDAASCPCLRAILYYTCYTYYTMLYYGVLWLEWRKVGQLLAMLEKRCDQVLASLRIVGAGSLRP